MTHAEFMQWCEYEAWEEQRTTKFDLYLARITAMLQAQLNPKGSYSPSQFLLGDDDGGVKLREMSDDEVKAFWRKALPWATYNEADNG